MRWRSFCVSAAAGQAPASASASAPTPSTSTSPSQSPSPSAAIRGGHNDRRLRCAASCEPQRGRHSALGHVARAGRDMRSIRKRKRFVVVSLLLLYGFLVSFLFLRTRFRSWSCLCCCCFLVFVYFDKFVGIRLQVPWAAFTTPFTGCEDSAQPPTYTQAHTRAHTHTHLWLVWNSSSWCCCCFGNCVVFSFSKMDIWPLACPAPRSPLPVPVPVPDPVPSSWTHIYQCPCVSVWVCLCACVCGYLHVGFKTLNNFGNGLRIDCKLGN